MVTSTKKIQDLFKNSKKFIIQKGARVLSGHKSAFTPKNENEKIDRRNLKENAGHVRIRDAN